MRDYLVYYTVEPDAPIPAAGPSRPLWKRQRATSPKLAAVAAICLPIAEAVTAFVAETDGPRHPSGVPFIVHRFDLKVTPAPVRS